VGEVFTLPDLGEGLQDAEIVAWHVDVGDRVVSEQPLVSVETDKALVELPSPRAGRIAARFAEPGDIVKVGARLVEFDEGRAPDAGAIVGVIREAETEKIEHKQRARTRAKAPPAVRRLAHELGVDLDTVAASGPGGAVTKPDVEAAAARAAGGAPLRGVRRAMLNTMTRARNEITQATITDEADIDAWSPGSDVSIRLIRAVAAGCAASPPLNAWFDSSSQTLTLHEQIDLAVATETDDGLFAPVIRDAGHRSPAELRTELEQIKQGIAARSISREAFQGATFTLSNFGMFGGRFAQLVVVPPQVAILGAGRAAQRVVAVAGAAAVRRTMPLSLSFDHRVVTGVEATQFLNAVIQDLQQSE
jgi:2-oxoisovalerate dehydrogenase E2 component (dihydrolipoyl transacylase)